FQSLLCENGQRRERMRAGNPESKHADLGARGSGELNGATDTRGFEILVHRQREGEMPVGRELQGVGSDLRSAVITNHHRDIYRLRGNTIDSDSSSCSVGVVEGDQIGARVAALPRGRCLLIVVTENHKSTYVTCGAELR